MAKENNLTDFLTDVANAIREKKGSAEKINPQNFSDEIKSIQSGGALPPAKPNDVVFYDYDGTIKYSYSWAEVQSLTELPPTPEHSGLTCEGWNYTLADIKNQECQAADVAATYITNDGATRLHVFVVYDGSVTIRLKTTSINSCAIDWGDGSAVEPVRGAGNIEISHSYKSGGYIISIRMLTSGVTLGHDTNTTPVFSSDCAAIYKVNMGNIAMNWYAFYNMKQLTIISLPREAAVPAGGLNSTGVKFITASNKLASNGLQGCSLTAFSIMGNTTTALYNGNLAVGNGSRILIPMNIKTLGYNCFSGSQVKYAYMSNSVEIVNNECFSNCDKMTKVHLSENLSVLSQYLFYNCKMLQKIYIPPKVTTINASAFQNCSALQLCDFRNHTSVPTLANSNAFSGIPDTCKIVVPYELFRAWVTSTNWSSLSEKIIDSNRYID